MIRSAEERLRAILAAQSGREELHAYHEFLRGRGTFLGFTKDQILELRRRVDDKDIVLQEIR